MGRKNQRKTEQNRALRIIGKILLVLAVILFVELFLRRGAQRPLLAQSVSQTEAAGKSAENPHLNQAENITESNSSAQPGESEGLTGGLSSADITIFSSDVLGLEVPVCALKNQEENHERRIFQNYSICYRENYEQAEWSSYALTAAQLVKNTGRTDDFRADDKISTQSATLADYRGSGYDRGHLTPAADMAFSEQAMSETFFMSNMSPQEPQFNRGIWRKLEAQVRKWTEKFGAVYVVSGPVLDLPPESYKTIGENKVAVPDFFYKVILAATRDENSGDEVAVAAIGFIIPNKKCDDPLWNYARTVDEVEAVTNLDFYSLLDDEIEARLEANLDLSVWMP